MNNKIKGDTVELIARNFLKNNGYIITEKNYRCKYGEVDVYQQNLIISYLRKLNIEVI